MCNSFPRLHPGCRASRKSHDRLHYSYTASKTESETGRIPLITGNCRPGCSGGQLDHGHAGHMCLLSSQYNITAIRRPSIHVGLFNLCSVTGKSAIIQQCFTDNKLSIAVVTENWHDDAASPDLIVCAPPSLFVVMAHARRNELSTQMNHGIPSHDRLPPCALPPVIDWELHCSVDNRPWMPKHMFAAE